MKLNPEIKQKWVAALRSGEYEQGRDHLETHFGGGSQYCCLGVLQMVVSGECEDSSLPTKSWWDANNIGDYDDTEVKADCTPHVQAVINPCVVICPFGSRGEPTRVELSVLNDGDSDEDGLSFAQIADIIEAQL